MPLKTARFVALILLALALGVSFSHLLQAGPKATLAAFVFLDIHRVLFANYAASTAPITVPSLLATLLVLLLVRREPPAFAATAVACAAVAAMLLAWAAFVYPLNQEIASWSTATLPSDWDAYRRRWHLWQGVRAALALVAFGAFALSLLLERKKGLFDSPY